MAILHCDFLNGNDANPGTFASPKKTLQAVVNIGTGGDTWKIGNTSEQDLGGAAITWNTGFVANNSLYTTIESYDAGGSVVVQRPDETIGRLGATINGNNSTFIFSETSFPQKLKFKNINFKGHNIAANPYMIWANQDWTFDGCSFDGGGGASRFIFGGFGNPLLVFNNNYFFNSINGTDHLNQTGASKFIANFFDVQVNNINTVLAVIASNGAFSENIIKITGIGRVLDFLSNVVIEGNTIIGNGANNQVVFNSLGGNSQSIYNNVFRNINGVGSLPINTNADNLTVGYNAYSDSNASVLPAQIQLDLTGSDIIGTGDPFVNSAGFDFTPTVSSGLRGAGLGNPNSFPDIGAVQSQSQVIVPSTDENELRANRSCN